MSDKLRWKMEKPCANCPFSTSDAGKHLAGTLGPGRLAELKRALRTDHHFICHKTTESTGNGTNLVCAGALAWQEERGLPSNYQRVCERLAWMSRRDEAPA